MAENANFERIISIFKPHFYDDTIFRKIQFFVIFDLHLDIEKMASTLKVYFYVDKKLRKLISVFVTSGLLPIVGKKKKRLELL